MNNCLLIAEICFFSWCFCFCCPPFSFAPLFLFLFLFQFHLGNDYAELCDLGPSRWSSSSRNYHQPHSSLHHSSTSASTSHIRSNSFEAEDIIEPYGNSARITNSTSSLRASGRYYSPPGTSYTIIERPHSPHYYSQQNP